MSITFEELKKLEPGLEVIEKECLSLVNSGKEFDALEVWHSGRWDDRPRIPVRVPGVKRIGVKRMIVALVGNSREKTIPDPEHKPPSSDGVGGTSAKDLRDWPEIPNPRYHPELATKEAYDVAYDHLLGILERTPNGGVKLRES